MLVALTLNSDVYSWSSLYFPFVTRCYTCKVKKKRDIMNKLKRLKAVFNKKELFTLLLIIVIAWTLGRLIVPTIMKAILL